MTSAPRPVCFVAMPFGKKTPPGKKTPLIDFDRIYFFIRKGVTKAGLECIRADEETTGGFIHRPMYERLLLAEYVIADLTFANSNVAYEVGVRHGCGSKATLLVCADVRMKDLPFDLRPLRIYPYPLGEDYVLSDEEGARLLHTVKEWFDKALGCVLPVDNPILQVTSACGESGLDHGKTDAFIQRVRFAGEMGNKIHEALLIEDKAEALQRLKACEQEAIAGPQVVPQIYTVLLSIYIAYREIKAYEAMVALYDRLPSDLRNEPVTIEQLALALNRLAEKFSASGDPTKARELRRQAQSKLEEIPEGKKTCDTYGVMGRLYKAVYDEERRAGNNLAADAALQAAIDTYEAGFRHDPRDYYPGVNAVTLRVVRDTPEDRERVAALAPVVQFALDRAPNPKDDMERYWQAATRLELACALKNWQKAGYAFTALPVIDAKSWMRETTVKNLTLLWEAFGDEIAAKENLSGMIAELKK